MPVNKPTQFFGTPCLHSLTDKRIYTQTLDKDIIRLFRAREKFRKDGKIRTDLPCLVEQVLCHDKRC